jgi:hypothetical protein
MSEELRLWAGGAFETSQRLVVLGSGSVPKARVDRATNAPKCAPDGRPTFSTGTTALVTDDSGELVPARGTVSVHVIEAADRYGRNAVQPVAYLTEGRTWITPYVSNGFSAYSVVCERLVPYVSQQRQQQEAAK